MMDFTTEHISTDFLIIGGGVAGLRAAVELARNGDVLVVTKDAPTESSTEYAQGGVAVALSDEDEISIHFDDTIKAGDGLCIRKAVGTLVAGLLQQRAEPLVVRGDHAAVAAGHDLHDLQRERHEGARLAYVLVVVLRPQRVRRVLDQGEAVPDGDRAGAGVS